MTQQSAIKQPSHITDIIENANEYIAVMRESKDAELVPKILNQYRWEFFRQTELDEDQLQSLAIFVADKTYRIIVNLEMKDKYTWAFFAKVIPEMWDALQDRGVDVFYIIDNELREDRFDTTVELFTLTGAAVVTPYSKSGALSYGAVEKQIKEYMAPIRNILYVEKNDSVNYVKQVKELATQSKYLAIFRNRSPDDQYLEILN